MMNNNAAVSRVLPGVFLAVLLAVTGLSSCGGGGGGSDTTDTTPTTTPTTPTAPSIPMSIEAAAAWASTPYRSGTITYYCDCGTGAEGDCVAGADTNAGTASSPKQTIASAITTLNAASSNDTVALCKGGPFNAAAGLSITRSNFTPASGSPLINAGNALHGSTLDITDKTRPFPPAIGAFEP